MKKLIFAVALAASALLPTAATADPPHDGVCPQGGEWTGHFDGNDLHEITVNAPPGLLIVEICVKAGSANQGDGPEFTLFNPGVTSVTFTHSSGKEISHYSLRKVPVTTTTTSTSSTSTTSTTVLETTTTTAPDDTTTSTVIDPTTTTVGDPSTTVPTAISTVTESRTALPRTGPMALFGLGLLGSALITVGAKLRRAA